MKFLIGVRTTLLLVIFFSLMNSCKNDHHLFEQITSDHSGIHFNNQITESDSINVLDVSNVYNGGGVGIGDFNKDGLQDIYFTGNLVSNKLYLNKGGFHFEDITATAGVDGEGKWCRGVAVVDINNDGWPDIFVCATIKKDPSKRKNLLYINQGVDDEGIPHFKEMAKEYGFDDTMHSTMAAFFDYDNDGDLDMYLVVNEIVDSNTPNYYHKISTDGSFRSSGHLYRNDWIDSLKHPVFTDVTKKAGVGTEGYGHAVNIADINGDGWKDIYVTNDYLPNDLLWINNHDGTFSEHLSDYFKHTSANAMGMDISDINNDGLADVIVLDMNPEDNYRKKMMLNPNSYQTYINTNLFNYNYQYVRNTLQVNQGPRVKQNDSVGNPIFSDVGFYAGVAETDWSWTPLVTDFDNDGYRDIIITNGFPKDVTEHDFIAFRNKAVNLVSKKELLKQIPEVKRHNYAYHNTGSLRFDDVSTDWGFTTPTFSNGAVYADLDNDGDLDIVINNINDEAMVYRNNAREGDKENNHYLQVEFVGDGFNRNGLGAIVELHYDSGKMQVYDNTPYRGYLSTVESGAHFGLGKNKQVDSVIVKWPNGKMQLLLHVSTDQKLTVKNSDANTPYSENKPVIATQSIFREITDSVNVHSVQKQRDYIDFNIQKLLPHKFSEYGPALAVGDIDGNGYDDIVMGGSVNNSAELLLQQPNGKFIQKNLLQGNDTLGKRTEDEGILLFDADGDGDLDLYIASGGYQGEHQTDAYRDRLYVNDGKGNFFADSSALPTNFTSKFCVRAADFDHDGDLDLFISGRVDPGNYPKPVSSFIYRNDSKNGVIKFTDVTATVAKDLVNIGMVCDAIWTDFDNDGWPDLILAGEWMPVRFLKNDKGIFKNVSDVSGVNNQRGWWNSIVAGDFDNDGDMDYVVGNLGLNSFYRASDEYPVRAYAKDFDNNGIFDVIPSLYLPDVEGRKKEFPAFTRDDLLKQVNAMRKKYPTYKSYALSGMDQLLTEQERKGALILEANNFHSIFLRNDGQGKFTLMPLPYQAQLSVINGMVADDFDGDGNLDLVINGNDYGTEVSVGRYDALNGLFLKGDGKGDFVPQTILQSGIFIPGNGKALVKLRSAGGRCLLAAGQNRGPLKIFASKKESQSISFQPGDISAIFKLTNGKSRKEEIYFGSSFLSQSGRFLNINKNISSVEIANSKGEKRTVSTTDKLASK
ncbi:MAG: VCBS repeat-containing protein [Bacteroidetes bacterium]|nr:VCBS repeat-containing protein [Bacteroidota bacterium]